jgi:hypothetical protein
VNDPFVEYVVVEDLEDFEQQQAWVEGKQVLAASPFMLLQHAF